jgi:hypothetical protein
MITAFTLFSGRRWQRLLRHVGRGVLFTAGVLAGFAPQLILQRTIDHSWVVDRYGVGTGRLTGLLDNLWGLFFWRHGANRYDGLLPAMPLSVLVFVALVPLLRLDRRLGALLTATLALQLFAIGSYELYWGYFEFGTSYLMPSSPIFVLALASLLRAVDLRWGRSGLVLLGSLVLLCVARNGSCLLHQLGDDMIGGWESKMGAPRILHELLLLQPHKLNVDVLTSTSEFGCLLREAIGAVHTGRLQQLLVPLFWFSLLLVPLLLVGQVRRGWARWSAWVGPRARRRYVLSALSVAWLAAIAWLVVLGARTNVDYDYDDRERISRDRELLLKRLGPGKSFTWNFSSSNPCELFSIITFLEGAVDVPQGQPVTTVQTTWPITDPFELAREWTPRTSPWSARVAAGRGHRFRWTVLQIGRDDSSHFTRRRPIAAGSSFPAPGARGNDGDLLLTHGTLNIARFNLREVKLPRDPSRRRWLAGNWQRLHRGKIADHDT